MRLPPRISLRKAIKDGLRLPLSCVMGLEALRRSGHDVYVTPEGVGGSILPSYLIVELHGPSPVDPSELCPGALVIRDGLLRIVYSDREQFRRQDIRWDHRRWVGNAKLGTRTIEAPAVEVTLYPRGPGPEGPMVYWSANRGPAKAWSYGNDPLGGHWQVARMDFPWSETLGYLYVRTGHGVPYERSSAWGPERVAQDEAFARQALTEAIVSGWPGLPR